MIINHSYYIKLALLVIVIKGVPLATEPGVRQETGWLAGGPLLRVATIRRTTDTHYRHIPLQFSHNCSNFVVISSLPGSVASGTHCTYKTHGHTYIKFLQFAWLL
jgi:hypothetical protein